MFTFEIVLHDSPSLTADVNTRRRAEKPVFRATLSRQSFIQVLKLQMQSKNSTEVSNVILLPFLVPVRLLSDLSVQDGDGLVHVGVSCCFSCCFHKVTALKVRL